MQSGLFWKSKSIYTSILRRKNYRLIVIIFHKRASYLDPGFGDLRKFLAECKISEKKMHDNKKKKTYNSKFQTNYSAPQNDRLIYVYYTLVYKKAFKKCCNSTFCKNTGFFKVPNL